MKEQWKRNAVVATVLLFVCAAVYLNWRYAGNVADTGETQSAAQEEDGGGSTKVLGDATLVGGVPTVGGGPRGRRGQQLFRHGPPQPPAVP